MISAARLCVSCAAFFGVLVSSAVCQMQWKRIETLRFETTTIVLETPRDSECAGDFCRLRILIPGHPEFVLVDHDGLVNFRKDVCAYGHIEFCKAKNLVSSDRVLVLPVGERVALFVFGWAYASSTGSFHAVGLDTKGNPYEFLRLKEFDLMGLIDVDGDGVPEIVGKKCLSQEWGNHFLTYDPYSVYHLPGQQAGRATYSLQLSKRYNIDHYYGWAGPDCREDVAVVLHPPHGGKPVIMNSKEAENLFNEK